MSTIGFIGLGAMGEPMCKNYRTHQISTSNKNTLEYRWIL